MTLTKEQFDTFLDTVTDTAMEEFGYDAWRSTSLLIQLTAKMGRYLGNLAEINPDDENLYKAHVIMDGCAALISESYNVPTDDERFEEVQKFYDMAVGTFIQDLSDDALIDMVMLGHLSNFIAGMRTYAWDTVIKEQGPSESKFEALKLAKRDEMAVKLATTQISELLFV